jgi:hypothetical protein
MMLSAVQLPPMTDKEIALELGKRLIEASFRVVVMTQALDRLRDKHEPVPWRSDVAQAFDAQLKSALYDERIQQLQDMLASCTEANSLPILATFVTENYPRASGAPVK